jgi:hypothetical protein
METGCCCMFGGCGCCFGSGYCSECVGNTPCNAVLCGSCMTGCCWLTGSLGSPTPGTNVSICTNTDVSACLPFAGVDENNNDIYCQCGKLVYSDGSAANRCDISCNECACRGTPCSPRTCGSTDQPPIAGSKTGSSTAGAPQGGGSGGGTAKPSGGSSNPVKCNQMSQLSQSLARLGSTITSALTGGQKTAALGTVQKTTLSPAPSISSNAFLMVIIVIGAFLLVMAFGHRPTGD